MNKRLNEEMLQEMFNENFIEISKEKQEKINGGVMLLYAIAPTLQVQQKVIEQIIKYITKK